MTCSMTLILPCLFHKYLRCHTLSLLSQSPFTARKLSSTRFKWLVPEYFPPTSRPTAKPPLAASPEEFIHDQATSAQMTFECYFSCFMTQHHHFRITVRSIYIKLWEEHKTSIPLDLGYTRKEVLFISTAYQCFFCLSSTLPTSSGVATWQRKSENTLRLSLPKPHPLHETPWENSATEGIAQHREKSPFLGLDEARFCSHSAGDERQKWRSMRVNFSKAFKSGGLNRFKHWWRLALNSHLLSCKYFFVKSEEIKIEWVPL